MTVSLVSMKCDCLVLKCRHCLSYAIVMFQKVWYISHFVKLGIEYTCGQICLYIEGSPVEIQTPGHRILIGHDMTALLPVLLPSSILPPPLSHCTLIPTSKNSACILKWYYFKLNFSFTFKKCINLKLHKSGSVCIPN